MLRVSWCHLDSFNSLKVNCNSQRLLTEATVGAYRAGSRVDFSSTGCCVALSRSDASEVGTGVVGMWCGGACAVLVPSYIVHTFALANATSTDLLAKSPPKTPI